MTHLRDLSAQTIGKCDEQGNPPAPFTRRNGTYSKFTSFRQAEAFQVRDGRAIGAKSFAASFDTCCAWYVLITADFKPPALSTSYLSPVRFLFSILVVMVKMSTHLILRSALVGARRLALPLSYARVGNSLLSSFADCCDDSFT